MLILISRIYYLSIQSSEYYKKLAHQNITKKYFIKPVRGIIRDANNIPLAINKLGFSILIAPHLNGKNFYKLHNILLKLTNQFPNLKYDKLLKRYKRYDSPYNHRPIQIVDFIPYDEMISNYVKLTINQDIFIEPAAKRHYPKSKVASHVIGYLGKTTKKEAKKDAIAKEIGYTGKNGLEKYYNEVLQGELGVKKVIVTASNKEIKTISQTKPISSDLTLALDIVLQEYIDKIFEGRSGAVVVMNAKTGEILSAGSYPEFDLNIFVNGIDQKTWAKMINDFNHPFTNKIIQGLYPPGSSIKPSMALTFLNSRKISPQEEFFCSGTMRVGKRKRKFRCWNSHGHGYVSMKKAIESSCDIYFYEGSFRIGIDTISKDLKRYGFGKKTGVDLPNEFIGTVPNREWKMNKYGQPWYIGDTLNTSIGQGNYLVTPLQIALTTAQIAVGYQVTPHFAKKIGEIAISFEKRNPFNDFEKKYLPFIRKAMLDVCYGNKGTARNHIHSKVKIAGKTGTAQVVGIPQAEKKRMSEEELKHYHKSHAWFTAFGPFEDPQYVVTVVVEHGGHGGSAAGGIVSDIFNKLLELGYIDKRYITQ
jgi:penicillin-binding protein 2